MQTQTSTDLSSRETYGLIGSDKVEGTPVYRSNGESIGKIERVMIDKLSGNVAYAVMTFGGFLGLGSDYYPIPWSLLTYNTALGGYEVNVPESLLKNAPKFSGDDSSDYETREQQDQLYRYYNTPPYWAM